MRVSTVISLISCAALGQSVRLLHGNDDGWYEMYTRVFLNKAIADGHDVVSSCPAENKSGSGSNDAVPQPRTTPCEYNSCSAKSGPTGTDPENRRFNWVNSYPVTGIKYGIDTYGPQIWNNKKAELAVTGPNVGANLYILNFSGTVGAAVQAAKSGVPAIAISASSGPGPMAYDPSGNKTTNEAKLYAELSSRLVNAVVKGGAPFLPNMTFLNVNLPAMSETCKTADDFKFVLTRVSFGVFSGADATVCGTDRLPNELAVYNRKDCFIPVSVADANDKTSAYPDAQAAVAKSLDGFLSCLPK